jgi:hypothetical protein
MDDCCRLVEMMLGAPSEGPLPLYIGVLEILSTQPIAVTAVYTTTGDGATAPAIEVVQVDSRVVA